MMYVVLRNMFENQIALWSNPDETHKGPLIFKTIPEAKRYINRMSKLAPSATNFIPQPMSLDRIADVALNKGTTTLTAWLCCERRYTRVVWTRRCPIRTLPSEVRRAIKEFEDQIRK